MNGHEDRSWITGTPREVLTVTLPSLSQPRYYLGLDLGQLHDYMALVIAEQTSATTPHQYAVRHLERLPLGTSYPQVVAHVQQLLTTPALHRRTTLVIDATGCRAGGGRSAHTSAPQPYCRLHPWRGSGVP